jgi:biotin-dependent carboxylase-like uncharacterized protein
MHPLLNGEPVPMTEAIPVRSGDRLDLGPAVRGVRAYLAVAGGIDVPVVLGSRSTDLKAGIGGFEGRKLRTGDVLRTLPRKSAEEERAASVSARPVLQRLREAADAEGVTAIRFRFGPQDSRFSEEAKRQFTRNVYTVGAASDRMGYRLEGPAVETAGGTDILSDGICFGSIQIPADGRPIVMMADHQTTGGYAKIGTVLSGDLPLLAQLGPGKKIRFEEE